LWNGVRTGSGRNGVRTGCDVSVTRDKATRKEAEATKGWAERERGGGGGERPGPEAGDGAMKRRRKGALTRVRPDRRTGERHRLGCWAAGGSATSDGRRQTSGGDDGDEGRAILEGDGGGDIGDDGGDGGGRWWPGGSGLADVDPSSWVARLRQRTRGSFRRSRTNTASVEKASQEGAERCVCSRHSVGSVAGEGPVRLLGVAPFAGCCSVCRASFRL